MTNATSLRVVFWCKEEQTFQVSATDLQERGLHVNLTLTAHMTRRVRVWAWWDNTRAFEADAEFEVNALRAM
jgi:hypothetical protein